MAIKKKLLALLLSFAMILSLAACGSKEPVSEDPNCGLYEAAGAEMWGMEVDLTDLYENGFSLELKDKGKCTINADGKKANGKWTLEGEQIHLSAGGIDIDGTLHDGIITVPDLMGIGVSVTFINTVHPPKETQPQLFPDDPPAVTDNQVSDGNLTGVTGSDTTTENTSDASETEPAPEAEGGYYGKSHAGATGYVDSLDTMKAVLDDIDTMEWGVYPTYEEIKELFGGVDGAFDPSRSDEKRNYYYWYLTADENTAILFGFSKQEDGGEKYSNVTWKGQLS